jgi:hypothetical protein
MGSELTGALRSSAGHELSDAVLEALWKRVLQNWESDDAHAHFLEHCRMHSALAQAAARYRGMSGDRERGPVARQKLEGVAALALASLESARSSQPKGTSRALGLLLVLVFVVASGFLLAYMRATR